MIIDKMEMEGPDLIRIYGISKVLKSAGFYSSRITFTINLSDVLKTAKIRIIKKTERGGKQNDRKTH